mmetsp:Transcript_28074/g.59267  ORF Transcript_28074/g.59267 Transcript_28074/m.59267 type:complete len:236 (-) Transcript_28074:148-855(-)
MKCVRNPAQIRYLPPHNYDRDHGMSISKNESARLFALTSATSSYLIVFLPLALAISRLFVANSFTNISNAAVATMAASFCTIPISVSIFMILLIVRNGMVSPLAAGCLGRPSLYFFFFADSVNAAEEDGGSEISLFDLFLDAEGGGGESSVAWECVSSSIPSAVSNVVSRPPPDSLPTASSSPSSSESSSSRCAITAATATGTATGINSSPSLSVSAPLSEEWSMEDRSMVRRRL